MNLSEPGSQNDSPEGVIESLSRLKGWSSWGEGRWIAAALGMAAQAGARLGGHPREAEAILASITPSGPQLDIALSLAARCGSISQMERFVALGANLAITHEEVKKAAEQREDDIKHDKAPGPFFRVSNPFSEAILAARCRASLWIIEKGIPDLARRAPNCLVETVKWRGEGESQEDQEKLRDALWSLMNETQREDVRLNVTVPLTSIWADRINIRPRDSDEIKAERRHSQTFLGWMRRAVDWGWGLNPPEMTTPMGGAILVGDLEVAKELLVLGARLEDARNNKAHAAEPLIKNGAGSSMALLLAYAPVDFISWAFDQGMEPKNDEEWAKVHEWAALAGQGRKDRASLSFWIDSERERRSLQSVVDQAAGPRDAETRAKSAPASAHRL